MSAGSSPHSKEVDYCRPGVLGYIVHPSADAQLSDEHDLYGACTPKLGITRHYTPLKDHADVLHNAQLTPGGGRGLLPLPEDRRDGFAWDLEELRHATPCPRWPPAPQTPPTLEELSRADFKAAVWEGDRQIFSKMELLSPTLTKDVSIPLSLCTPSRTDTSRSSTSEVARGMIRHVPDFRMFHPAEKKNNIATERSNAQLAFAKTILNVRKPLEHRSDQVELPAPKSSPPTLKDRRQLARKEAMELSLPLKLPELPPRGRIPVAESYSLVPSRPRSPETPWIKDRPPEWYIQGPKTAPAIILEEEPIFTARSDPDGPSQTAQSDSLTTKASKGLSRGRVRRGNSRKSTKSSHEGRRKSYETHTRTALDVTKQFGQGKRCRSRRFHWGSSNHLTASPQSERSQSSFALSRLLRLKRSDHQLMAPPSPTRRDKSHGRRKQSMTGPDLKVIDNMTVPQSFVPPGLKRILTPPMFDSSGQVKRQLADFFFDLQGVHAHKTPASPGGVWDSDALLMSQHTDLEQSSSASEEPPRDHVSDSPADLPNRPLFPTITTPSGGTYTPVTPSHHHADVNWTHAGTDSTDPKDPTIRGNEEIAKLEWLIPEHLPTSPLCPLHAKYRGPSKGLCVFHSTRRHLSEARTKIRTEQLTGMESENKDQSRKSGAVPRRESSALDGSEDADEAGEITVILSGNRPRARRWWRLHVL